MPATLITIPAVDIPFPRQHPAPWVDEAIAHVQTWTRDMRMIPTSEYGRGFDGDRLGELAARAYVCADVHAVLVMAEWQGWFIAWDDPLDNVPAAGRVRAVDTLVDAAAAVMHSVPPGQTPAAGPPGVRALAGLWQRTWALAPPGSSWGRRFATYAVRFLRAYQRQARFNAAGDTMTPTYFADFHRLDAAGAVLSALMVEPAMRMSLTDRALADLPEIQAMYEAAGQIIGWLNDLYSAAKEIAVGDRCSYITVLHHHTGLSYQDCAQRIADRILDRVDLFSRLLADLPDATARCALPPAEAEQILAWGRRLAIWIREFADWHVYTGRYEPQRATTLARSNRRSTPPPSR
jgi:Terpene synthase family 2, C-terminal metal binding